MGVVIILSINKYTEASCTETSTTSSSEYTNSVSSSGNCTGGRLYLCGDSNVCGTQNGSTRRFYKRYCNTSSIETGV